MDIKNIEAFLMIAEKGSFSDAAEELMITQPTISVRIKQLENEFDTILFKRINGKKITLTEVGELVYPQLKEAISSIKNVENTLKTSQKIENCITISSPNHMGVNIIPELLKVLYKIYPSMEFKVRIEETKDTIQLVRQGDVKFGLGYIYSNQELEDRYVNMIKITDEENILVCQPNHPLTKKKQIDIDDLRDEKIIIYNRSNFFQMQQIENFLKEQGIKTHEKIEINNLGWIKMMVRKGIGVTILQEMTVEDELKSGQLVQLNFSKPFPLTPLYLISNPQTPKELIEIVTKTLKKILIKTG